MMIIRFAEMLDVGQIMRSQDDGYTAVTVDALQELPDSRLGDYVESDRWFIQIKNAGIVEERCSQVATHPPAQAKSCRTGVLRNGSRSSKSRNSVRLLRCRSDETAVDMPQQIERFGQRQIPPELSALTEKRRRSVWPVSSESCQGDESGNAGPRLRTEREYRSAS